MIASVRSAVVVGCVVALAAPRPGRAQPVPDLERAAAAPSAAHPWAGFYFRFGAAIIEPITSSRELELASVDGPATLAVDNGPIAGSGATIGSAVIPAGSIGWVIPTASRRLSLELVLGTPFTAKFQATGSLANESIAPTALGIPTGVGPLGSELGEAEAIPIVLTAICRPIELGRFLPYFGAGPSVLFARNAKVTNRMLTEVNQPEMTIDPAPGLVLQGGFDAWLTRSIYARLDVKFIAFMTAHAEVRNINVKTPGLPLFDSVEVGTAKMDVTVNPLIVLASVGFDFDLW